MTRIQIEHAIDAQKFKKAALERQIDAIERKLLELKQMLAEANTEPLPLFEPKKP